MNKDFITLIGGLNSLGVPYTRDNKEHIGFFNLIEEYLRENGYKVDAFNLFRLNQNHTWDFEKAFNQNYSLSQMRKDQIDSIAGLRNVNPLFKLIIPSDYLTKHSEQSLDDRNITEIFCNSQNPIFIYSCGPNDFFSFIGAGPVEILDKNVRNIMPKNYEELILKTITNVKRNLTMLNELNSNTKIIVLGMSDSPLYKQIEYLIYFQEKLRNKSLKFNRKIDKLISFYNINMSTMCQEFDNVSFIDISEMKDYCAPFDFHPNLNGNRLIANRIIESMDKMLANESQKNSPSL